MASKSHQLLEKARRCRELAETAMTDEGRDVLMEMAVRYEVEATASARQPAKAIPA